MNKFFIGWSYKFGKKDTHGIIYYNGLEFGNIFKAPKDWGRHANKWIFNRAGYAIDSNFWIDTEEGFDTPEQMLNHLEKTFKEQLTY